MGVEITPEIEEMIQAVVRSGNYASETQVVHELEAKADEASGSG